MNKNILGICFAIAANGVTGCYVTSAETMTNDDVDDRGRILCVNKSVKGEYEPLSAAAAQKGQVAVLVELRLEFTSEGDLDLARREAQRAEIRQLQEKVLQLLEPGDSLIAKYSSIPAMAVRVSQQTLDKLFCSEFVGGIREQRRYESK